MPDLRAEYPLHDSSAASIIQWEQEHVLPTASPRGRMPSALRALLPASIRPKAVRVVTALLVADDRGPSRLVRHVVHARLEIDARLEGGAGRHVRHAFAVNPDLAPIAQPGAIFFPVRIMICSLPLLRGVR